LGEGKNFCGSAQRTTNGWLRQNISEMRELGAQCAPYRRRYVGHCLCTLEAIVSVAMATKVANKQYFFSHIFKIEL
jgi:hypothetical protein